jgi:hypothetical protein
VGTADAEEGGSGIVLEGDTVAIGNTHDSEVGTYVAENIGSVSLYSFVDGEWTFTAKIYSPDYKESRFGRTIVLDGSTLAVAATSANIKEPYDGRVYVYKRQGLLFWNLEATLNSPVAHQYGYFGSGLQLRGDLLIAGKPGWWADQGKPETYGTCSVYVYRRVNSNWNLVQTLDPFPHVAKTAECGSNTQLLNDTLLVAYDEGTMVYRAEEGGLLWDFEELIKEKNLRLWNGGIHQAVTQPPASAEEEWQVMVKSWKWSNLKWTLEDTVSKFELVGIEDGFGLDVDVVANEEEVLAFTASEAWDNFSWTIEDRIACNPNQTCVCKPGWTGGDCSEQE